MFVELWWCLVEGRGLTRKLYGASRIGNIRIVARHWGALQHAACLNVWIVENFFHAVCWSAGHLTAQSLLNLCFGECPGPVANLSIGELSVCHAL